MLKQEYSNMATRTTLLCQMRKKKNTSMRRVVLYDLTDAGEQAFLAKSKILD